MTKELVEGKDILTLEEGAVLHFRPLPPLAPKAVQVAYERKHPKPEPPTYEQVAAGGVTVVHVHDETTVETDEEKAELAAYEEAQRLWDTGLTERLMNLFLGEGTALSLTPEREADWNNRLVTYGIIDDEDELPDQPLERKLLYLNVLGMKSKEIIQKVSTMVMKHTGVDEEDLEAAEALF